MYFELLPCRWEAFDAAERAIAFRDGGLCLYDLEELCKL